MTEWVFVANCGIYKLGSEKEKPAAKWSTEVAYTDGDDRDLKRFCNKLRNEAGLDKRCGQLDIQQYEVELSTRTFDATPGYPTGRCLSVDSNKSWENGVEALKAGKRELIGKMYYYCS